MINKELKKLSRRELVDIIYQMKQNEQNMQEEIASLQKALQDKRMRISTAGSIAEAAVDVTQIFFSAQKAADLYLYEIAGMKEDTERECARMKEETEQECVRMIQDVKQKVLVLQEDFLKLQESKDESYED